ncbi:unnamed protein product [Fraxinus pennsylvanica]|uniref:Retrotransposon Copia-like N-terminal domain-containing protein n=1 Tax=Fraxinus pennsylvanica TaxID=56036 RepID=A0AAD2DMU8_9LAMI|nr:unnamed protein product [Fraxinus pennsylvanica]
MRFYYGIRASRPSMILSPSIFSPNTSAMSSFSHLITTKLTTDNFPLWKVQITAYLQAFASWKKTDKLVPSILFSSISETAKQFQVRFQLANLSRGEQSITDYFGKVRTLANILATTGNPLLEPDFVTYLLTGRGPAYDTFVTSINTQAEPISSTELYQLLLIHESRLSHSSRSILSREPSANFTESSGRIRGNYRGARHGQNGNGVADRHIQTMSASSPNFESNSQPSTPIPSQVYLPLFPQSILGPGPSRTPNQPLTASSPPDTSEIPNPSQIPNSATLNSSENPIVLPPRSLIMTCSHINSSRPRVRMDGTIPHPYRACFSTIVPVPEIPSSYFIARKHSEWQHAMQQEYDALI